MSNHPRRSVGTERSHAVSGFFVFCLIGLFALLSTTLTLISIRAYRNVDQASTRNSDEQIVLSYLLNKVHAYDAVGAVSIRTMDGVDLLCLRETADGTCYETRIYAADGMLREYFAEANEAFDPELGEPLCALSSLRIEMVDERLLRVEVGGANSPLMHIALRAGEAGMP
ncbi:MAG: DUF4860 domain-containing protein [Clostridia bacterium]